ncbi:PREDICTED: SH3 and multiple ankyrin repeat domains protein 2-like [Priapulus caudatus]|uniref:SH3 and multiple ankyrin repeat domains protein 2-like n=1 Tax=Priapulus caudatus TaxID=37621 RepID=A0ABM1E9V9_PRICU|nr:PREDICTED: SH3 and multiple ankyrin repeat domains protein 2-like [Priapulus caudatus]
MSVAAHPGTPQYARPDRWQGKAPSPAQSTRSLPQFSSAGSTLSLSDSSSNMNHADVDDSASSYNSGKSSNSTSPVYVSPKKRLYPAMPGRTFVCVKPYLPKEDGELALKKGDFVDVLSIGERGFWEGKVGHREGWFPNDYVEEVQMRRRKGSDSDDEDSVILNKNTLAALVSGQLDHQPKTVVLQRSNKGFGFVLRGARSLGAKLNFHPTDQFPALQYLDDVDKDGMGWKAGLRPGDFVIEINGEDVRTATHERVVQLIQGSGELVALKVITVKLDQNTKTMTLPLQRKSAPKPPARDPRTSLSVGRARANSMVSKLAEIEASMARRNSVSYDSEGRSTKSSSIESLQTALGGGEQPRTASIKARPTSRRITAQELQEIFVRTGGVTARGRRRRSAPRRRRRRSRQQAAGSAEPLRASQGVIQRQAVREHA